MKTQPPFLFAMPEALQSAADAGAPQAHHDPVAPLLIGLVVILLAARFGGEILERLRQPAVLGELVAGVVIGNLDYLTGLGFFSMLRGDPFLDIFARVGAVVLRRHARAAAARSPDGPREGSRDS